MKRMFTSATVRLTTWYLVILIVISILFSFIIFELSTSEISSRLERLQIRAEGSPRTITLPGPLTLSDVRESQANEAEASIFIGLVYMNLAVIGLGGIGSYLLARATMKPIEQAHEQQSRFTSDASHELRTPLAIMKSEIQVALRDKAMTHQEYRQVLKSTLEEVDKLSQLSESLLQLSRAEHGLIQRTDKVDIIHTIQSETKSLGLNAKRLRLRFPDRAVIIEGNTPILQDLFRILLDNAVKYSNADSPVDVEVLSNGRSCVVRIANDGPGIEKAHLHKVFDRFYRIDKSRTSEASNAGYGLGLSLAKHIVAIHDGTISVTSTPGKKTEFSVTLPHVRKNR